MIPVKVEITGPSSIKSGTGKNGKPYSFKKQPCFFHMAGSKYPVPGEIQLDSDVADFAPGMYSLSDDSFYVDRWRALCLSPKLVKAAA